MSRRQPLQPQLGLIGTVVANQNKVDIDLQLAERPRELRVNQLFVHLLPEQFAALQLYRRRIPEKDLPAYVTLERDWQLKKFKWQHLYPFGVDTARFAQQVNAPTRRGIATLVHYAVTNYLANRYAAYRIRHKENLPRERKAQLEALGIDTTREYRLPEYARIVNKHVEAKFQHIATRVK